MADGQYRFDGVQDHVALTEPEKHGAIHGFLRWQTWHVVRTSTATVAMGVKPHPMEGRPFLLDVEVDRSLDGDRLTVMTTATNAGVGPCAHGTGQHPYLSPGVGLVDQCTLQIEAGARIGSDDEHHLPTGAESVDRTTCDFRESRLSGPTALDFASTDLICGATGRARARLAEESMADEQSSGLTRATRRSSSMPATTSHPNGDGVASVLSRWRVLPTPQPALTGRPGWSPGRARTVREAPLT